MFKTHLTPDSDSEALIKNLICNNLAGQFGGWKSLEELWPFDDSFNQTNPLVWLEDRSPLRPREGEGPAQGRKAGWPTPAYGPETQLCP